MGHLARRNALMTLRVTSMEAYDFVCPSSFCYRGSSAGARFHYEVKFHADARLLCACRWFCRCT